MVLQTGSIAHNIPIYEVQNIEPKINNMKAKQPKPTNYAIWAEYYGGNSPPALYTLLANGYIN